MMLHNLDPKLNNGVKLYSPTRGELLFINGHFYETDASEVEANLIFQDLFADDWRIIPKAQSAEEWVKKTFTSDVAFFLSAKKTSELLVSAFKAGEQNDRKRTQPLIDACEKSGTYDSLAPIKDILKRIKPLEPETIVNLGEDMCQ